MTRKMFPDIERGSGTWKEAFREWQAAEKVKEKQAHVNRSKANEKRWQTVDPEKRRMTLKKMAAALSRVTPEARSAGLKKAWEKIPKETRTQIAKARWENIPKEKRTQILKNRMQKFYSKLTPEERRARAKASIRSGSEEKRKTAHAQAMRRIPPEKNSERGLKAGRTHRRNVLKRYGAEAILDLPVVDKIPQPEMNRILMQKKELIEQTVKRFLGSRYNRYEKRGFIPELLQDAYISALTGMRKWDGSIDMDSLIQWQIISDAYDSLAKAKTRIILEGRALKPER